MAIAVRDRHELIRLLYPGHSLPGQIVGVARINTGFYDIQARATASSTPDQMREMARTLLADRFKLTRHTEKRQMLVYELSVARADGRLGPGMTKPAIDCDAYRAGAATAGFGHVVDVLVVDRAERLQPD